MMWLMNEAAMWTKMVRIWLHRHQPRGDDEVFLAHDRNRPRTTRAQLGPAGTAR
jgi:hypothetical protein